MAARAKSPPFKTDESRKQKPKNKTVESRKQKPKNKTKNHRCSRCCRHRVFPSKELSNVYQNFENCLMNILTDPDFHSFMDLLINNNIIPKMTFVFDNKIKNKKIKIDDLVLCDKCGIFMEANRYYNEMYLFYMYYLINTNMYQFEIKLHNIQQICSFIQIIKNEPNNKITKQSHYTGEMKIIESLQTIVNQLKPNIYLLWNATKDHKSDRYIINFHGEYHFKELEEKISTIRFKDRAHKFTIFMKKILQINPRIKFEEFSALQTELKHYQKICQTMKEKIQEQYDFAHTLQNTIRELNQNNSQLVQINAKLNEDKINLINRISTSHRLDNLLNSVPSQNNNLPAYQIQEPISPPGYPYPQQQNVRYGCW